MRVIITQNDVPPPIPAAAAGGIVAQPGGQSGATPLTARVNIVTNVASGTGVVLTNILGGQQTLRNAGTFPLSVYPPSGTQIESYGLNNPATVQPGDSATLSYDNNVTWYLT